ncbi:MAG TPA: IPT/TIG domain-containing protein, partial [Candidatus Dormibacteraeota bacterium]|nr:IPT/TIG domain-containing protein [Candidatus Dormibacteraeota bacterium]
VSGGDYEDSSGGEYGLIETLSGGSWTATTAPTSGLSPAAGSNPTTVLAGVSCPVADSCVAAGSYHDASGNQDGLVQAQSTSTSTSASAVCTWTGAGGNTSWSTGGNWSGTGCTTSGPPAAAQAVFPAVANETIVFDSGATAALDSLVFQAGGYTISQGAGAPTMTLTPTASPAVGITMDAPSSTGPDTLSNPIDLGSSQSFSATYSNGWRLALSGVIAGSGAALTVTGGGGEVDLQGANTYSGGTTVTSAELLTVANNSGLGPSSSPVTVENGGSLSVESGATLANPVAVGAGGGTLDAYTGTDTLSGAITLTGNTNLNTEPAGGALVLSGPISDGGSGYALTVDDASPSAPQGVTLSGVNTYSGGTTVSSGTLVISNSSALGSTSGVLVDSGADLALDTAGGASYNEPLTLGSGSSNGALLEGRTSGNTWSGPVTLPSSSLGWFTADASKTLTISGPVTGSGALDTNGTGTVVLSNANDSYTGATTAGGAPGFTLDVTGTLSASAVTVDAGATLEGTGTVAGITSGGTVHPGASPGVLTTSAGATLAAGGTGSLSVDITGATVGSGYSQLSAAGAATLTNATLAVADSYPAAYGTVFTIVAAGGISGTFANAAQSAVLTVGGRLLQVGYSPTAVTLTDVTNPPPPPTVTGVTPGSGGTAGGTAVTVTGTNFVAGGTTVTFGGAAATGVGVQSPTELTATTPAHAAGPVTVTATTAIGTSTQTYAQYIYLAHPSGEAYAALPPYRILDTRKTAALAPGGQLTLPVAGTGSGTDAVPAGAVAVVLNVTVTEGTRAGVLTVYPAGLGSPPTSNLNWVKGETVPNLVTVPLSPGGAVGIVNRSAGSVDVVVDVEGYYAAPVSGAGQYAALTPARILDTRYGTGGIKGPIAGGQTIAMQVTGRGGVPASGVAAVVLNVTVTQTTRSGFLTAYPTGTTRPTASNVNWVKGETVANRVMVPVGTNGQVALYNSYGDTQIVVDVSGYLTTSAVTAGTKGLFVPVAPHRLLDTRVTHQTLGPGAVLTVPVAGQAGVPASGATAAVMNVTVTNTTTAGFLTVYPAGVGRPTASDINWVKGQTVPNMVVATLGSGGSVDVYNSYGHTDVVVDVVGWFS